jgi:hypothetical protein
VLRRFAVQRKSVLIEKRKKITMQYRGQMGYQKG